MMRVFYGMAKSNVDRYRCHEDDAHVGVGLCIGIGGRIDLAVALQILDAVSDRAVEAAILASDQVERSTNDIVVAKRQPSHATLVGIALDLSASMTNQAITLPICLSRLCRENSNLKVAPSRAH